MPLDKVGKNFAWPCETTVVMLLPGLVFRTLCQSPEGLGKQKISAVKCKIFFSTPNYHPSHPWIDEQKEIRKISCTLKYANSCGVGLADPKSCSLIIPAKATLSLSVRLQVSQADFCLLLVSCLC